MELGSLRTYAFGCLLVHACLPKATLPKICDKVTGVHMGESNLEPSGGTLSNKQNQYSNVTLQETGQSEVQLAQATDLNPLLGGCTNWAECTCLSNTGLVFLRRNLMVKSLSCDLMSDDRQRFPLRPGSIGAPRDPLTRSLAKTRQICFMQTQNKQKVGIRSKPSFASGSALLLYSLPYLASDWQEGELELGREGIGREPD